MTKKIELQESFVANSSSLSRETANKLIADSLFEIEKIKEDKKNDDKLIVASDIVKALNKSYKAQIDYEREKINFLMKKLEDMDTLNK